MSSAPDTLFPKTGFGSRVECFESLTVMLRPSQSCSITSFWGECKSLNGSPKLSTHVATLTLGAQGFRSQEPHKSRLQRVSPVSLREKSKSHVRATRHLCRFFPKRTRGSRLDFPACPRDADRYGPCSNENLPNWGTSVLPGPARRDLSALGLRTAHSLALPGIS